MEAEKEEERVEDGEATEVTEEDMVVMEEDMEVTEEDMEADGAGKEAGVDRNTENTVGIHT